VELLEAQHGYANGEDTKDAGEFAQIYRHTSLFVDGKPYQHEVWRSDCEEPHGVISGRLGSPEWQGGTYRYDRSGWCPGDAVRPWRLDLGALEPGEHTLEWKPQDYNNPLPDTGTKRPYWQLSGLVTFEK
jgi:hypothetical protein